MPNTAPTKSARRHCWRGVGLTGLFVRTARAAIKRLSVSAKSIRATIALCKPSLTAGTIFAHTLLPLTKWFQGIYLLTQAKNSISTLEIARLLGVRPDTASLMRHQLMTVMADREASRKLNGRVEMDDAVLGGVKHLDEGGKRGRGGPN